MIDAHSGFPTDASGYMHHHQVHACVVAGCWMRGVHGCVVWWLWVVGAARVECPCLM